MSILVKSKGEDEQIEIKKQIESFKGLVSRKKDAIAHIEKLIQENKNNSKSQAMENIESLKEKIEDAKFKIDNKNDEIKIIEENIKKEKDELDRILSQVSSINKSTNEHLERRTALRREFEAKQDAEKGLLKEKLILDEQISRHQRDIDEANEMVQKSEESKKELAENAEMLEHSSN
ncbi:MAG: hypothetical protein MZV70_01475 [Desulfobacterales bacterium]|nr:hypothetical protein [Desulfobacterales bacterium]